MKLILCYLRQYLKLRQMKIATILLLAGFIVTCSCPARAAFLIEKKGHEKAASTNASKEETVEAETQPALSRDGEANETITNAVDEFRSLPRAERRERIRDARQEMDMFHRTDQDAGDMEKLLPILITILLPPLAVGLYDHGLSSRFWIALLLSLAFYIPGLVYALMVTLH